MEQPNLKTPQPNTTEFNVLSEEARVTSRSSRHPFLTIWTKSVVCSVPFGREPVGRVLSVTTLYTKEHRAPVKSFVCEECH